MPWYEPPSVETVEKSLALLRMLAAVDHAGITTLGRNMARLPVHPRLARLMLEGARRGHASEAAMLAALLSERDVFQRSVDTRTSVARRPVRHGSDSDLLDRLSAMETFERNGDREFEVGKLNAGAARFVLKSRDQLLRRCDQSKNLKSIEPTVSNEEALLPRTDGGLSRPAGPTTRAEQSPSGMIGGRGIRLADFSAVTESELLVCVDVDDSDGAEARCDWPRPSSAIGCRRSNCAKSSKLNSICCANEWWRGSRRLIGDLAISESESNIPPDIDPGECWRGKPRLDSI